MIDSSSSVGMSEAQLLSYIKLSRRMSFALSESLQLPRASTEPLTLPTRESLFLLGHLWQWYPLASILRYLLGEAKSLWTAGMIPLIHTIIDSMRVTSMPLPNFVLKMRFVDIIMFSFLLWYVYKIQIQELASDHLTVNAPFKYCYVYPIVIINIKYCTLLLQ